MHIPDGIVPVSVAAGGWIAALPISAYCLKKIKQENVPEIAVMTAVFFVSSWIHIPVPPLSVHFVLNGLIGMLLGPAAFISIFIGLIFQTIMFQHGGILSLGLNAIVIGGPALVSGLIFKIYKKKELKGFINYLILFFISGFAITLSVFIASVFLFSTIPGVLDVKAEQVSIILMAVSHLPVIIIEGLFTVIVINYLKKVKPGFING